MLRYTLFGILFLLLTATAAAQSVRLAQIETAGLIARQEVDLYLAVTDSEGNPTEGLSASDFQVFEGPRGGELQSVPIVSFAERPNAEEGVTFFLLVDNSGSMYDTLEGRPTENPEDQRIAAARGAIRDFVNTIENPADQVALASFNTYYRLLADPTTAAAAIGPVLDDIEQPDRQGSYTELYRAVELAATDLSSVGGRRVLIILSDGENYPYAPNEGEPHPVYGENLVNSGRSIEALRSAGASAFGIRFATAGDPELERIARESGGLVFDAASPGQLSDVYREIRERVLQEYRLSYRANMYAAEERAVRVRLSEAGDETTREFFAGSIFGAPVDGFGPLFLIPLLLAVLLAGAMSLLQFRNRRPQPNLEVLNARGRATQLVNLGSGQTVIGGSDAADLTIAGSPDLHDRHATVVFDEKRSAYTVVSDRPIRVNNQSTNKRELSPGDVIQLPGATVVFDLPEESERDE
jgi:Mg-chelatase subunit ChlD